MTSQFKTNISLSKAGHYTASVSKTFDVDGGVRTLRVFKVGLLSSLAEARRVAADFIKSQEA
jgi:hypothetical protein